MFTKKNKRRTVTVPRAQQLKVSVAPSMSPELRKAKKTIGFSLPSTPGFLPSPFLLQFAAFS